MERVVITGMGAITPVGNDVPTFWESLKTGKCGIGPITKFDVSDFKVKLGAEVKDFDPTQYMEKREARRADANVHYAMAAAIQAVEQAGLKEGNFDPYRTGVIFGSGVGGLHVAEQEVPKLLEKGPGRVSPFAIPEMIANIAAGTIAITAAQGNKISSVGAGGIAGYSMGIIFQCFSTVYVTNDRTSYSAVAGGIVGKASAQAVVDSCGSYGAVGGRRNINYIGGIAGVAQKGAVIRYCTNYGAVTGSRGVGGIVGLLTDYAQVRLCEALWTARAAWAASWAGSAGRTTSPETCWT